MIVVKDTLFWKKKKKCVCEFNSNQNFNFFFKYMLSWGLGTKMQLSPITESHDNNSNGTCASWVKCSHKWWCLNRARRHCMAMLATLVHLLCGVKLFMLLATARSDTLVSDVCNKWLCCWSRLANKLFLFYLQKQLPLFLKWFLRYKF